MRVLALTKVFPNRNNPHSMPTFRRQCLALARQCDLEVWATIPWFPGATLLRRFRHVKDDVSQIPRVDSLFGLEVTHPRTVYLPRFPVFSGAGYMLSIGRDLMRQRQKFDVILATWAYPDGAAAIALGQLLGIPTVVQVIGSDIDLVAQYRTVRPQLRLALPRAAGIIAVSSALAEQCVSLGAKRATTEVIVTGVDRDAFSPRDRTAARLALGVRGDCRVILFVGRLCEEKGALDALRAFESLSLEPHARIVFVGDGPLLERFRTRAAERKDIIVTGTLDGNSVGDWIAACDLLTLPSYHEGTPNVVLEALSSGRPVVATRVGGIPDVCSSQIYGELVAPGSIPDLAHAYERVLSKTHDPEEIAACPTLYSWEENARRVLKFLRAAVGSTATSARGMSSSLKA